MTTQLIRFLLANPDAWFKVSHESLLFQMVRMQLGGRFEDQKWEVCRVVPGRMLSLASEVGSLVDRMVREAERHLSELQAKQPAATDR